jgi:hypothetical protein
MVKRKKNKKPLTAAIGAKILCQECGQLRSVVLQEWDKLHLECNHIRNGRTVLPKRVRKEFHSIDVAAGYAAYCRICDTAYFPGEIEEDACPVCGTVIVFPQEEEI